MLSAAQLHQRGLDASNEGRYAQARRWLRAALDRASDEDTRARIEGSLAYVESEVGDQESAWAFCEAALSRRPTTAQTRAILRSQRGLLHLRRGETKAAVRDFNRALPDLGDDAAAIGRLLLNRGNVHLQRGDVRSARDDFQGARASLLQAGRAVQAAKAQHNEGYAQLLLGEVAEALTTMDAARSVLAPLSPVSRAVGEQDRAEVLIAAGLVTEGEQALAAAARAYGLRQLRQFQGEAELVRARTLLRADPRQSRVLAGKAKRRFGARGADSWQLRADAVGLMATVGTGARTKQLVVLADDLARQLRQERLVVEATYLEIYAVRVLVRRGDLSEAGARLRRVRVNSDSAIGLRILAHEVGADLDRARGNRGQSFDRLRAGLAELHAWQASFGSLDLQSGVVGHGRQLAIDGLRMALADGSDEVVFEWSERARALASRITPVRAPADHGLSAELAELRWLQAQQPEPRSRAGRRLTQLRRAVREHAWRGAGSGVVAEPVSLGELQNRLDPGVAVVAYLTAGERVCALVVTQTGTALRDLGPLARIESLLGGLFPDLDMAGSDLPPPFASSVRAELAARLADLDECLVRPLLKDLGAGGLIVTPSGLLAGVPWGMLPGLRGRPVSVAQSATSWLMRQNPPVELRSAGFVAGPRVPRAEAEVAASAAVWPASRVLTGSAATAAAVSSLAGQVDVLHVSAHGRHSSENPLFSGVELVDGPWFGYDIDQLQEIPALVLLSACEVGRSEVRYGEELIGMTAAWLHAGARVVIASAAAVNDEVAHDVLLGVHRGLRAGQTPAEALAAALPEVDAESPPAPFVCFS